MRPDSEGHSARHLPEDVRGYCAIRKDDVRACGECQMVCDLEDPNRVISLAISLEGQVGVDHHSRAPLVHPRQERQSADISGSQLGLRQLVDVRSDTCTSAVCNLQNKSILLIAQTDAGNKRFCIVHAVLYNPFATDLFAVPTLALTMDTPIC